MDEKVKVITMESELNTGMAQKSENFVGTGSNEERLVNDMMRKVPDSWYCTRAFKSKEKDLQCFIVSDPVEDYDYDYKINCRIEVTIVLKDDMLNDKEMNSILGIDDLNELLGETGLKEQIIEETNAFIDELNRRSEGISFTVLDSDADGHLPEWDYNDGKYMVAVDNEGEHRDHLLLNWKDVNLHIDHITEEETLEYEIYVPRYESESKIEYLLKESEIDKMKAKNKKDIGIDLS